MAVKSTVRICRKDKPMKRGRFITVNEELFTDREPEKGETLYHPKEWVLWDESFSPPAPEKKGRGEKQN